jgi:hypothetical protein
VLNEIYHLLSWQCGSRKDVPPGTAVDTWIVCKWPETFLSRKKSTLEKTVNMAKENYRKIQTIFVINKRKSDQA